MKQAMNDFRHITIILWLAMAWLGAVANDSITLQALRDDIKQFLNYQIPDSLRQYEYAKDYCRAAGDELH